MSYIVPRDKPTECRKCPFCHGRTYDCRLQKVRYESFEEQIQTCPLVSCDNMVNLCDSCRDRFADCEATDDDDVIFGGGEWRNCIFACSKYRPWYAPKKSMFAPEGDTPWKRLNGLVMDINPAEIADQISRDNLRNWCHTIQTEMAKCLVTMKVDEEELR